MKKLIVLSLILAYLKCEAQLDTAKRSASNQLMNTNVIVDISSFSKTTWDLSVKNPEYAGKPPTETITIFDTWLKKKPAINEYNGQIKEYTLLLKYQNDIDTLFTRLGYFGGELGKFFARETSSPARFTMYNDTALCLLIPEVYDESIYNTIKFTARQRAQKQVITRLLPGLKYFVDVFDGNKEIKYYGLGVFYGSKNFVSDEFRNLRAEMATLVVPVNILRKYVNGEVTEDEIIAKSDIWISDRDMSSQAKKIKIVLE